VTKLNAPERLNRYTYDGLLRLISAAESPGNTNAYDAVGSGGTTPAGHALQQCLHGAGLVTCSACTTCSICGSRGML